MKNRMMATMLVILALMLGACGPTGNGPEEPVRLDGTRWVLQTMDGEAPLDGTTIIAEFADGEIRGSSGCNSYFGSYTLEGNNIEFGMIGMTEMACMEPEGIMEQESAYLETLRSVAEVRHAGDQLEMMDDSGDVVLRFTRQQEPEAPVETGSLDGTAWTLESFVEGETATSLIAGTTITLQFSDGQVTGSAGCNSYGGSYMVEDGEIAISELFWTEMACLDPEGVMEQEQRYLDILTNVSTYEREAGELTLRTPDDRGLAFEPES